MNVEKVHAVHFKNYKELKLTPAPSCNVIFGVNGAGKTNFLDLIHFACLGKSYFSIPDKMAIQTGAQFLRIECHFNKESADENSLIELSIPEEGRKKIWNNGSLLERSTDILGLVPVVALVPDDIELVNGGGVLRRKFMDRILCQASKVYTESLTFHRKILSQKLALLKSANSFLGLNSDLLATYDIQLNKCSEIIYEERKNLVESFLPIFKNLYDEIAEEKECIHIQYVTNFIKGSYIDQSKASLEKDFYSKRISIGLHRDDLTFSINGKSARKLGSQGQIKTFVYALKLGEYSYLSKLIGSAPILLLDDIFEKLDRFRLEKLFNLINSNRFGQIFITDTESERSVRLLKELKVPFKCFKVEMDSIFSVDG